MRINLLPVVLALSALAAPVFAQKAPAAAEVTVNEPGKVGIAETLKLTAGVVAIDKTSRMITLKTASGKILDVVASSEVKNFDQVKVGDQLVVQYVAALTLQVKKGSSIRESTSTTDTTQAKPGEKPGVAGGREVTILANVLAVDPKKMTITVKGPKGNIVDLNVKNPEHFKAVKKGDQIEMIYVEAMAIAVEPAPKKAAKK